LLIIPNEFTQRKEPCHVFRVQVIRKIPVFEGKHPPLAIFIVVTHLLAAKALSEQSRIQTSWSSPAVSKAVDLCIASTWSWQEGVHHLTAWTLMDSMVWNITPKRRRGSC
jgi:hypothetical protein